MYLPHQLLLQIPTARTATSMKRTRPCRRLGFSSHGSQTNRTQCFRSVWSAYRQSSYVTLTDPPKLT
jgi:hypothetical protein